MASIVIENWSNFDESTLQYAMLDAQGVEVDLAYVQTEISGAFLGFEFQIYVFFWVLITPEVLFGLLNICSIFKCFRVSTVFFGVQFHSTAPSVNTDLHYCHIAFNIY